MSNVRGFQMPDVVFWPLFITFAATAIAAVIKTVEAVHAKKLSDDECVRLRAQLDVLNNPINKEAIYHQPVDAQKPQEPLEPIREKILALLAKNDGSTKSQLADTLKINVELVVFHLNELLAIEFVHHPAPYAPSETWSLAQEGRAYLVKHGLL